jgi:hypothetical protein
MSVVSPVLFVVSQALNSVACARSGIAALKPESVVEDIGGKATIASGKK